MASLNPDQEQQQNNQQPQQPTGGPVSTGGSGGAASGGQGGGSGVAGATSSPVAQNQAPQQNTGYTDVASYLDANKAGTQQLGGQVAQNLTNQYGALKGNIDTSAQNTLGSVNSGYVPENTDLISQVGTNASGIANDPSKLASWNSQLNDSYAGPNNWADYGTLQGQAQAAQPTADLVNQQGGLNVLAQQVEGPTASRGVNSLDAMLLGGSPDALAQVQAAAQPFSTIPDYLNSQNSSINSAIAGAQGNAAKTASDASNALTHAVNTFSTQVGGGAQSAEAARQAYNKQLNDFYNQAAPVQQRINQWAGSTQGAPSVTDAITPLLDANPTVTAPITAANFANADQYKTAAALQQLAGNSQINLPISQSTAYQAGTAPTVPTAAAPSLDPALMSEWPSIQAAMQSAFKSAKADPGNVGDGLARNVSKQYDDLVQYLTSVDPNFANRK